MIERLGHLGDGIASGPVYVPMALPGEVVKGEVIDGRIVSPKIVTPSPERVSPSCPHYNACGGCSLMHGSDAFVAAWKEEVVRTALTFQGLEASFKKTITSPPKSRRRATLAGRRTKKGAIVGFHGRASGSVIEIPNCKLLHPDLMDVLPVLSEITVVGASRKGELSLTVTRSDGGIDLSVYGGKPLDRLLFSEVATLAGAAGLARLSWSGEPVVTNAPPAQRFGYAWVVPPAGAFLQATEQGEASLVSAVREAVGNAARIADLFAGCGTFALPLADNAEVHAVEGEAPMLAALDAGWRQSEGLHRVTIETRDLFRRPLLAEELNKYEAVVIDPPRAGAEAQTAELAASEVPLITAVSCNPVTFARDARQLVEAGYRIDWVQCIDQFRWSPHVEIAALFAR